MLMFSKKKYFCTLKTIMRAEDKIVGVKYCKTIYYYNHER